MCRRLQFAVMPLPIIHHEPSPADLLRLFEKTEARWSEHLAEPVALDIGTAYCNAALSGRHRANNIRDVALPPGMSARDAVRTVDDFFRSRGARCAFWAMNLSTPDAQNRPLVEHLLSQNYIRVVFDVLLLRHLPRASLPALPDVKIIPARASFRHVREIAGNAARSWGEQVIEATELHLDDPQWEALLAIENGRAVAQAGVLTVGEVGRVNMVFVADDCRNRGIGSLIVAHVLDICQRATLRQVMLSVKPDNAPAQRLYAKFGFEKIGEIVAYAAPWTEGKV